jgi:uncharacterized protein
MRRLRSLIGTRPARELALVLVPSAVLLSSVCYIAYRFVDPAPPRKIVISTSTPGSGYERFARQYRERLAREGVELEIRLSAGSLENLERLRDPASGVKAGFTTTGAAQATDSATLASLGSVFYSPMFVFHRLPQPIDRFSQLDGKRISIGAAGTFIRSYARRILEASEALGARTELRDLDNDAALDALIRGDIDAAIFPAPLDAPVVQRALTAPGVRLMNVAQADAIAKMVPALTHIVLPRGLVSLAKDEPREDLHLLATNNSLLVRKDLHPAAQYLLLEAMREVHSPPGPFHRQGEFPQVSSQDLPLSRQAERFYRSGPPWLYQYMPYWLAVLLDRMVLVLIPLFVALIPILRYAPAAYRGLHRGRLWRLHRELSDLEHDLDADPSGSRLDGHRARLGQIERRVRSLRVPLPFEDELYHLRAHLGLLRSRLRR